jgi:hypothetical protein
MFILSYITEGNSAIVRNNETRKKGAQQNIIFHLMKETELVSETLLF